MNEIITKLDEIEKKAESILTDAAAEKEMILKQLEFDKREMDRQYASMRQKQEEEIKQQLDASAESDSGGKTMPLVVFNKTALDKPSEKTDVVLSFVKKYSYQQVFENEEYKVYAKKN